MPQNVSKIPANPPKKRLLSLSTGLVINPPSSKALTTVIKLSGRVFVIFWVQQDCEFVPTCLFPKVNEKVYNTSPNSCLTPWHAFWKLQSHSNRLETFWIPDGSIGVSCYPNKMKPVLSCFWHPIQNVFTGEGGVWGGCGNSTKLSLRSNKNDCRQFEVFAVVKTIGSVIKEPLPITNSSLFAVRRHNRRRFELLCPWKIPQLSLRVSEVRSSI